MSKQYYYAALRDGVVCYSEGQPVPTRPSPKQPRTPVRDFFAELGPGLITGAADDDPSGIATYSVTGAQFGYGPLWTALFSFPLMASVQLMCSRLAMVTGRGLAAVVRRRYPRWVLWGACLVLVVANTINIGADLGGMAEAMQMITGINSLMVDSGLYGRDSLWPCCSGQLLSHHRADFQMAHAWCFSRM